MSTTRVSEYDRFGPWIDEVLDLEDVPRLFRSHPVDFDAARLVLKVPRDIARRDANAAMNLYDCRRARPVVHCSPPHRRWEPHPYASHRARPTRCS